VAGVCAVFHTGPVAYSTGVTLQSYALANVLSGDVQFGQRLASSGISSVHSLHFFVVTAAAGAGFFMRFIIAFTGKITAKYTAPATSRKEISAVKKLPT
jgi:hypothetical protein